MKTNAMIVGAVLAFAALPFAVMLVSMPLCDLVFGFDDFPLGRMLNGFVAGLILAFGGGLIFRSLIRRGAITGAMILLITVAVFAACSVPLARWVSKIEQERRYSSEPLTWMEYVKKHGKPVAIAATCEERPGKLKGLQLDEVRLFSERVEPHAVPGRILIYPDTPEATRRFEWLPEEQPVAARRSKHYSQRRLVGSEHLVLVHVGADGRVSKVESKPFNWFTIYDTRETQVQQQ